jgi:hypothetical protein
MITKLGVDSKAEFEYLDDYENFIYDFCPDSKQENKFII